MGIHVACVGDSITQGIGASSSAASYPSVLGGLLGAGWEVENDGRSGTTLLKSGDFPYTNTVQFTASTSWATSGGDVVIQLGTNDSKPANWSNEASFVADCKALVAHYRNGGGSPRVWISLPPPATSAACCKIDGTVIANEVVPLLRTCATDTGSSVIDVNAAFAVHLDWLPDGVHPNDQGAALIAQTVRDALVRTPTVSLDVKTSSTVAPVKVTLAATATAAYGKIEKVRFYDDATIVAELTSSPWAITVDAGAGNHVYRAEGIETAGRAASSTSTAVTIQGAAVTVTPDVPPAGGAGSSSANETAGASMAPEPSTQSGGDGANGESVASGEGVASAPAEAGGCSVSTGGVGPDALATFLIAAIAFQRVMRVRAA